ncbi:MAG: GerMN domain-containing protein [Ilumatobacteraceae bacterium]
MIRRISASLAFLIALSSCAIPSDGEFQPIPDSEVPYELSAARTTLPPNVTTTIPGSDTSTEPIDAYFISNSRVLKIVRLVAAPAGPDQALATLSALDTQDPALAGLRTAISKAFSATVTVERGVATVDSTRGLLDTLSPLDQRLAVAQIVLTLTSRPGIGQVLFSVDGVPTGVPRGRGDLAGPLTPVTFDDYASLVITN